MKSSGSGAYCQLQCPFIRGRNQSPCDSNVSCSLSDFQNGWLHGYERAYSENAPGVLCSKQIQTYCRFEGDRDPACKIPSLAHIGNDIPVCQKRVRKPTFVGIRGFAAITGLETGKKYKFSIAACNSAGCSTSVFAPGQIAPAPRVYLSESSQCVSESTRPELTRDYYEIHINSRPSTTLHVRADVYCSNSGLLCNDQLLHFPRHVSFTSEETFFHIHVIAADDDVDEDIFEYEIRHSIEGDHEDGFEFFSMDKLTEMNTIYLTIFDNDKAGIVVRNSSMTLREGRYPQTLHYLIALLKNSPTTINVSSIASSYSGVTLQPEYVFWAADEDWRRGEDDNSQRD